MKTKIMILTALLTGGAIRADVRFVMPFYERYVAIDGVCAWPQLNQLQNGEIAALIWPETNHGLTEGAAECWNSRDGGISWQRVGVPVPHEPGMNRMNLASGLTHDGALITVVSGWDRVRAKVPPGQPLPPAPPGPLRGKTRNPVPAVSRDGGRTWVQFSEVPPMPGSNGDALIPHGRIIPLQNGKLGAMFYGYAVYFVTSADGGKTWQKRGQLNEGKNDEMDRSHNETNWLPLANGDLFAAARTYGDRILEAFRSTDGGVTWKSEGPLTMPSQHPASLVTLPDGKILLSYGLRNSGNRGIAIRLADSTARLWSDPFTLVDFGDLPVAPGVKRPTDGGYPSTIVTPDGMLITAYYTASIPTHPRYHMGVVRWKLDPAVVRWPQDEGKFRKKKS